MYCLFPVVHICWGSGSKSKEWHFEWQARRGEYTQNKGISSLLLTNLQVVFDLLSHQMIRNVCQKRLYVITQPKQAFHLLFRGQFWDFICIMKQLSFKMMLFLSSFNHMSKPRALRSLMQEDCQLFGFIYIPETKFITPYK